MANYNKRKYVKIAGRRVTVRKARQDLNRTTKLLISKEKLKCSKNVRKIKQRQLKRKKKLGL